VLFAEPLLTFQSHPSECEVAGTLNLVMGVSVGECGGWCSLVGRGHVIKKKDRREIGEAGPNTALILIKL